MSTIQGTVAKTEGIFERIVLPGLSVVAGWFAGPVVFAPLEDKIGSIDANGDGISDLDKAFGDKYNGSKVIAGTVVALIGFSVLKMGGFLRYLGLFFVGAALSMIAAGFNLFSPSIVVTA